MPRLLLGTLTMSRDLCEHSDADLLLLQGLLFLLWAQPCVLITALCTSLRELSIHSGPRQEVLTGTTRTDDEQHGLSCARESQAWAWLRRRPTLLCGPTF